MASRHYTFTLNSTTPTQITGITDTASQRRGMTIVLNTDKNNAKPCFIGADVTLVDSVVGPHVSIGAGSKVEGSVIRNSIIQTKAVIRHSVLENSMIGHSAEYANHPEQLSLSDYSTHQ